MKTIEKTTTTQTGLTIKVKVEYGNIDKTINADGDIINLGSEYFEFTFIELFKEGKSVAHTRDLNFFYILDITKACWKEVIEKGAYARLGDQVVSKATYEAIMSVLADAKSEITDVRPIKKEEKKEEFVINQAYAHMSREEITAAEIAWDNLQNEGTTEGYNPYRDNLFVEK